MDSWSAFVQTLRVQFGPIDPVTDAEDEIDNLKMLDNQHILKYNVEFNRLAVRTGWNNTVLCHRYYSGLAERIKDIICQQGKPPTLEAMKALAHSIDFRHWERLRERSCSDNFALHSASDPHAKTISLPSPEHFSAFSETSASSSKNSAPLPGMLGKDGKLTPQERQRRFDNNLCLFCGGIGHRVNNCPRSLAKSLVAQTKENSISGNSDSENSDPNDSDSDSDSDNSEPGNAKLDNSVSGNSVSGNSVSGNSESGNSASEDSESDDSGSDSE
jgi:retrotransposon gag protein